jgi:hypothetical protein
LNKKVDGHKRNYKKHKKIKAGGDWRSRKRAVVKCSVCGKLGHNRRGCPGADGGEIEKIENKNEKTIPRTAEVKARINDYLREGQGSRDIAESWDVSLKEANHAIAWAKGIVLSENNNH